MLGVITPILENQMEKKMGHDMETGNKQPVQVHGYWFVLQGFGIWDLGFGAQGFEIRLRLVISAPNDSVRTCEWLSKNYGPFLGPYYNMAPNI